MKKEYIFLLSEKGLNTFLPLTKTLRQWFDRKKKIELPLFPSYIFVRVNSQRDIESSLSVEGACFFLKSGRKTSIVPKEDITNIKLFLKLDVSDIEKHDLSDVWSKGQECVINYGSMKGLNCEVINNRSKNKVRVVINSIGQSITATIPNYYLEPNGVLV